MRGYFLALAVSLAACSPSPSEGTIVASVYPLAYAAARMAPDAEVIDLTPPGIAAHDLELTFEQRSHIQDAEMVLYLGGIGFQPQVEQAVKEAEGTVIDFRGDLYRNGGGVDPHVWLDPVSFGGRILNVIAQELCPLDDPCSAGDVAPIDEFEAEMDELSASYAESLTNCRYETMIVSHEAFGYLEAFGLDQVGLSGLTPEAEPSAERLTNARRLIESGEAAALFYEARGEEPDAYESLAADLGVPAFPLDTLESAPETGDYFTVMHDNLASLRLGLECR